jgi:chromosomal replication initiator protein
MTQDLDKIWKSVLDGMKVSVSEATFKAYIKQTQLLSTTDSANKLLCEVACSSGYVRSMVEQRYYSQFTQELNRITEKDCEIKFVIKSIKTEEADTDLGLPLFETKPVNDGWKAARLKPESTFDSYAVGGSNQMAYAAATAVAKRPGTAYNPLFVYGGVGVGKTHLMQAIGHTLLSRGEGPVLFCTGEEFTNDLVEGIRNKSTDKVRTKYRRVKLLLIDDVQFIAGKASVQEEFFHTFNALQREGGQVVMTSDKPPAEIAKLEERLRSRFGAGMIVDIGQPDFELRSAILLIKAKQQSIELPMETAQLIATHIDGVRELQGFLTRFITESEMSGQPLSNQLAEKLLKVTNNTTSRRIITPNEVINTVGGYYGVGIQQLKGDRRTKTIVWPRQILMYLLRNDLQLPLDEVGRLLGGRDHTTVLHADEKVKTALKTDFHLQQQINEIKQKLLISS